MSKITIIQVLRKEPSPLFLSYEQIILANSKFLNSVNVEYIIYDTLESLSILNFIKNISGIKYFRKSFVNTRRTLFESGKLAKSEKIIFLKSQDVLTVENVKLLEEIRPNILQKDLQKILNIKKENFNYDRFNLLIKDNKTFFEKLKVFFNFN